MRICSFLLIFMHHSLPHLPQDYLRWGLPETLAQIVANVVASGSFGVELFFVLSGYLVTELMIRERQKQGRINLKDFYIRRTLRLWPLYLFIMALAWSMQWWAPGQHIGWKAMAAFLLMCGNWEVVFHGFPNSVIFPLWTVSVEEQFYLFWPWLLRKLNERTAMLAAAAMIVAANLTRWYLVAHHTWETRIWCNTFAQMDAMAVGILLALFLGGRVPRIAGWHRWALIVSGWGCFFLAGAYFRVKFDPLTTQRVVLGYPVAVLGALAILLGVLRPGQEKKPGEAEKTRPRVLRVMGYFGRISYGLYTFHICGLMFGDYHVTGVDTSLARHLLRNAVALAVTAVLAIASYHLLELPFLKLKSRFTHVESGRAA